MMILPNQINVMKYESSKFDGSVRDAKIFVRTEDFARKTSLTCLLSARVCVDPTPSVCSAAVRSAHWKKTSFTAVGSAHCKKSLSEPLSLLLRSALPIAKKACLFCCGGVRALKKRPVCFDAVGPRIGKNRSCGSLYPLLLFLWGPCMKRRAVGLSLARRMSMLQGRGSRTWDPHAEHAVGTGAGTWSRGMSIRSGLVKGRGTRVMSMQQENVGPDWWACRVSQTYCTEQVIRICMPKFVKSYRIRKEPKIKELHRNVKGKSEPKKF